MLRYPPASVGSVDEMSDLPDWAADTLEQQLRMNPRTWAQMQEAGVDETTPLSLEFFYAAPGEPEARALVDYLKDETDYDARTVSAKKGLLSKRHWSVIGGTRPQPVSLEILNHWVEWMVDAGAIHGHCQFDGWGAET
jgi:hypothetical protein